MKPKQIFISILAVVFVFPLMGTFAQQASSSGSKATRGPSSVDTKIPLALTVRPGCYGAQVSVRTLTKFLPKILSTVVLE